MWREWCCWKGLPQLSLVNLVVTFCVLLALAVSGFFYFPGFLLAFKWLPLLTSRMLSKSGDMSELVNGITECVGALLFQEGKLVECLFILKTVYPAFADGVWSLCNYKVTVITFFTLKYLPTYLMRESLRRPEMHAWGNTFLSQVSFKLFHSCLSQQNLLFFTNFQAPGRFALIGLAWYRIQSPFEPFAWTLDS